MKSMTLLMCCFALNSLADEITVLSVQDATTKKGSRYGASEVTQWTVVAFEGAPPLEAMRNDGSEPILFAGDWACAVAQRGAMGWCAVPRLENAAVEQLWGPAHIEVGRALTAAKIAALKKANNEHGTAVPLAGVKRGPELTDERTVDQLLTMLVKSSAIGTLKVLNVLEATTKKASHYDSKSVTEWTAVAFEGAPLIGASLTEPIEQKLFVGDLACVIVGGKKNRWCLVPRLKNPGSEVLWGPVTIDRGRMPDAAKLGQLRKDAEANGATVKIPAANARRAVTTETEHQLYVLLSKD